MSIETTCDFCGNCLDDSHGMPDFRARLVVERMPNLSAIERSVIIEPTMPLGRHDFCGRYCLENWLAGKTYAPTNRE